MILGENKRPKSIRRNVSEAQLSYIQNIEKEYLEGFSLVNSIKKKTLTVFGSARIPEDSRYYQDVREICKNLRRKDWAIITGGGPGIMTAALSPDRDKEENTYAFNIYLDQESNKSPADMSLIFTHFPVRKYLLRQSDAILIAPGGFGTMDEMMELLTLVQTEKHARRKIVLYDKEFWSGLVDWFNNTLLAKGMIDDKSMKIFEVADGPEDAIKKLTCKSDLDEPDFLK